MQIINMFEFGVNKKEGLGEAQRSGVERVSRLSSKDVEQIVACGQSAFGADMGVAEIKEHLVGDIMIYRDSSRRILGWCSTKIGSVGSILKLRSTPSARGVYLSGIAVHKDGQGKGVSSALHRAYMEEFLTRNRYKTFFVRTQNPIVHAGVQSSLNALKSTGKIDLFTYTAIKQPQVYGRQLTEDLPKLPENSEFSKLNREEGDAYVFVYSISYPRKRWF